MSDEAAHSAIVLTMNALREVFSPASLDPPLGGGTDQVWFFAGDGTPLAAFDAFSQGCDCAQPFVWARLVRRYRSETFPAPFVGPTACQLPVVLQIEIGAARCALVGDVELSAYEDEAEISLDDSWRIELALCRIVGRIKQGDCGEQAATDMVVPYGPEGGVRAWTGTAYIQL